MPSIYDIEVQTIIGKNVKLEEYKSKAVMVVNTASKCGFTKQYAELQELWEKYKDKGLMILGFPANNFMNQEPGDNASIEQFCRINYGVSFPIFAKISVRGKAIHPLFKFLTEKESNPKHAGKVTWNFNKFLISEQGEVIARFDARTKPLDPEVLKAIESALEQ
ncbi:MAG TPA: glutathione peroxidase [Candidatus Cloacimonadota bacterium]|nr:glutathione peroxidase [Candidatus Cloacimonadota bacterium]